MNQTFSISAVGASGERKATDTNFAASVPAAGSFSGGGEPAGRVISGAGPDGRALPSRTSLARLFFLRRRNGGAAQDLARAFHRMQSPLRDDDKAALLGLVELPPKPARFFVEPRRGYLRATHEQSRLFFLFALNGQLRRYGS